MSKNLFVMFFIGLHTITYLVILLNSGKQMGTKNRQLTPSRYLGQARFVVASTHVQSSSIKS